jgi:hypothetical protein
MINKNSKRNSYIFSGTFLIFLNKIFISKKFSPEFILKFN